MALIIRDTVTFQKAVMTMVKVDFGIRDLLFPDAKPQVGKFIEFDTAVVEGVAPEYNDFKNVSKAVQKDGKDIVRLAPINFNEHIASEDIDLDIQRFGINQYGENKATARERSALEGVAKLKLRADVGKKKIMYEVLATGKIAGGYRGKEGVSDIIFPIPLNNKEVLDGTTNKYWDDADAKPLTDLKRMYNRMKIRPTMVIMNDTTYTYFYENDQVATIDNTTNGTKRNFIENEKVSADVDFYKAGTIRFMGMVLDVYVEKQQRKLEDGSYVPFMPDKIVSFASKDGSSTEYCGIPTARKGKGVYRKAQKEAIDEIVKKDPWIHKIVFRTAPLPCIKNGEKFGIMQVLA